MPSRPLEGSIWWPLRSPLLGADADGAAERAVERRGVLRAVADQARLEQARLVEGAADRPDAAVHHVGGRDEVGACLGVRHRHPREQVDRRVVVHIAVRAEHAARAVVRELAEADVRDDRQLGRRGADRADAALHDAVVVPGARALRVLGARQAEQEDAGAARLGDLHRLLGEAIGREVALVREPRDRAVEALALDDEEGLDQVGGIEARLAHDPADRLPAAESAKARGRIGHQWVHRRGARALAYGRRPADTNWMAPPEPRPIAAVRASVAPPSRRRRSRLGRPGPPRRLAASASRRRSCPAFPGWCSGSSRPRSSPSARSRSRPTPGSASRGVASSCSTGSRARTPGRATARTSGPTSSGVRISSSTASGASPARAGSSRCTSRS